MSDHNWVEVGDRRWCLGCDLFQMKKWGATAFPTPQKSCPQNTPYARDPDKERRDRDQYDYESSEP